MRKKFIALDFDGVLHLYVRPWTDAATISDGPTPGAMRFLRDLVDDGRFDVVIVSSRLETASEDVCIWLLENLVAEYGAKEADRIYRAISFSKTRPPAFLTIDDRAVTFNGKWPDLDTVAAFKPWNKLPAAEPVSDYEHRYRTDPDFRCGVDTVVASRTGQTLRSLFTGSVEHEHAAAAALRDRDDLLLEVARRAYRAGCESHEFHEADCQDEVQAILDDLLKRKEAPAEYDAESVRIASHGLVPKVYPPAVMVEDDEGSRG